jgi:hypothetical protein
MTLPLRVLSVLGLLTGCAGNKSNYAGLGISDDEAPDPDDTDSPPDDDTDDPDPPDDTGTPPDDTGDPPLPVFEWTEGPDLPDCEPQVGDSALVALSGVLLAPDGPVAGHLVYSPADGRIICVGDDCDVSRDTVVCTEGVISPGLIDAHDHLQYNVLPPWQHDGLFSDRYDWRSDGGYWDYRTAYDEVSDSDSCDVMKWAELRALVSGSTSAVGSYGGACIDVLVRNLDEDENSHGIADYEMYYSASTVTSAYGPGDTVTPGSTYSAVENHVAEGVGGSVRGEIDHMIDVGMTGPGQIYVHATDATTEQLAQLSDEGTAIAWSPRSNLDLYGATTAADVAHRMGVDVVLGPDWTWSGSMNPVREMACAHDYLRTRNSAIDDVTLWSWTTGSAARVLGLDAVLGSLEVGLVADIAVYAWSNEPYRAVIQSEASDVRMVLIGGQALYGVSTLVDALVEAPDWCETVSACGDDRTLCVQAAESGDDSRTAAEIEANLAAGLAAVTMPEGLEYAGELLGLWMCEDTRASCDIRDPSSGDDDGDWTDDGDDLCSGTFDPLQTDHDGDGVGDACDPCPLDPSSDTCAHTPGDVDGDGEPTSSDICPYIANPDQADGDGDGKGDLCDLCPDEANPGDAGCTFTLSSVRNPAAADHPPTGSRVVVHDLVVTAVQEGVGFFVQDPSVDSYGGIFAYDGGSISGMGTLSVGDVLTIEGTYEEYYGLSELSSPDVTMSGSTTTVAPQSIADPCAVATDGDDAERLESMLITVSDVSVTDDNPDAPDDFGEFEVGDCLRVDDMLSDFLVPQPSVGTHFDALTGVLTYSYGEHKLIHRGADDVVE